MKLRTRFFAPGSTVPPYLRAVMDQAKAQGVRPGVVVVAVKHDSWCEIFRGRACNCSPEVGAANRVGGGDG